jgi:RimJ/RimL family protein N-acetyltransferase
MQHGAPVELVGKGIVLQRTVWQDAEMVFEAVLESNDILYPGMRWALPIPSFEKIAENCNDVEGKCLGRCSLHHIDWEVPKFEVGYWVRSSAQGKGVATEATRVMATMAFEVLGARRVSLWCAVDNVGSRRVAEKLGFLYEGRFKNDEVDALGRPVDIEIFALTR